MRVFLCAILSRGKGNKTQRQPQVGQRQSEYEGHPQAQWMACISSPPLLSLYQSTSQPANKPASKQASQQASLSQPMFLQVNSSICTTCLDWTLISLSRSHLFELKKSVILSVSTLFPSTRAIISFSRVPSPSTNNRDHKPTS